MLLAQYHLGFLPVEEQAPHHLQNACVCLFVGEWPTKGTNKSGVALYWENSLLVFTSVFFPLYTISITQSGLNVKADRSSAPKEQ